MLDADTKRKIDKARDILVGKVPDPKTQVEQITFALIYKFMDGMDQLSVDLGGQPSFFANGYEQFAWSRLMDLRLGGSQRLDLYVRALEQMSANPHIPQLFRDIFKGAFLPYRDSETLNLFLKEMDGFNYTHSEDLGDAYEYLLSILGTQGRAGQFRTPRHIIDFIVRCVDPDKHETILDPACGTAGFLISAFKHIQEKYQENPLSPDEKKRLTENFTGYDISPDMVRLSLVNMYLHQFPNPTILEYDTLTTEDRWDDSFDVILANPPFMTPTGGIRPHNRFAVRANRSEVLFVDYIAEHLNPGGRAGIIVPEGIIFQSANAYKALRKMLVESGYLYAVVSLPAGVFQPYSGVKTSILLLDKSLARGSEDILFVKVEADGFDLGAQRRPVERDDLPEALRMVKAFQADPRAELPETGLARLVKKSRLAEGGEFNLSAERYKENGNIRSVFPLITLERLESEGKVEFLRGQGLTKSDLTEDGKFRCIHYGEIYTLYPPVIKEVYSSTDFEGRVVSQEGDVLVPSTTTADANGIAVARALNQDGVLLGGDINVIRTRNRHILGSFLSYIINFPPLKNVLATFAKGTNIIHLSNNDLRKLEIPLPPLEVQQEIVAEIEGYQKVIDGARMVVENYKPVIPIDPSWPLVKLGEIADYINGFAFKPEDWHGTGTEIIRIQNLTGTSSTINKTMRDDVPSKYLVKDGDLLISWSATIGFYIWTGENAYLNQHIFKVVPYKTVLLKYLYYLGGVISKLIEEKVHGNTMRHITRGLFNEIQIPLPTLDVQQKIVAEIDKEHDFINANRTLIELFETKIAERIRRVWEGS